MTQNLKLVLDRGESTSVDEVLGPTLLCINIMYGYFSLLGFKKLGCGSGERVGVSPNLEEEFSVLSKLGEGSMRASPQREQK